MMPPRWDDVNAAGPQNMGDLRRGQKSSSEARGESFTIPAEKASVAIAKRERSRARSTWRRRELFILSKQARSLYMKRRMAVLAREIKLDKPTHYYTSRSPDSRRFCSAIPNRSLGARRREGQSDDVGNDLYGAAAHAQSGLESDSKWVAYSSRLRSMYHAIFVSNAETGETKQVTDGLADAVWPAWDAGGKYLWFLASTDFGLRSQWLDMTSYDHDVNFGLYFAVLKKSDASPLLPESDEDRGVGTGRRTLPPGACPGDIPAAAGIDTTPGDQPAQTPRGPRQPVTVQIDFDGLSKRVVAVPGVGERQYSELHSGTDGIVFFLEAPGRVAGPGAGNELVRYRLCDRRMTTFVARVAAYEVSADGRKVVYRAPGPEWSGAGCGPPPAPLSSRDLIERRPNRPAAQSTSDVSRTK